MTNPMIDVQDLRIAFGPKEVVKGVTLSVPAGESFGIVGESGSGKSTVLRALAGLNQHWTGEIRFEGAPVASKRPRAFFRKVQMVFQDPFGSLHPRQTIDRILSEFLSVNGLDDVDGRVNRALDAVALPQSVRFRFPHQLSGGQRQRVAIARALIAEPKVLLLDEPTSALDVSVQAEVLNLLGRLRKSHGLTYVMVSHNMSVVAHLCDRLGVMQHGEMVEQLSVTDLRARRATHPHTRELVELGQALASTA
ncbi:ABC transporter ATP-binding protein [Thalassorhabdomicrobium marinisediminis]|nr:ABC transporter ATP-binding protein [Thalassorhabdomicrobium marinisediminis]